MLEIAHLNAVYDEKAVFDAVDKALTAFYSNLTQKLEQINLQTILARKNPYLYRAKGFNDISQIIEAILSAYISSSEETLFGNIFFEPIALSVSGGQKAVTEGVDITVDREDTIYSIAVKSGTSVFNADSRKRQEQNFQAAHKRVQQARKRFVPVIGYGYGRKNSSAKNYLELAGKDFWEWLTGDPEFYVKIIAYMGTRPDEYAKEFEEAYSRAKNRLCLEFSASYCNPNGSINWEAFLRFNSGERPKSQKRRRCNDDVSLN